MLVGKSTVPVGTAAELGKRAQCVGACGSRRRNRLESRVPAGRVRGAGHLASRTALCLAYNMIRCAPRPAVRELYGPLLDEGVPFLVTDLQTAELVKVSANAFLATKISFINAISEVCEAAGADVTVLADALGLRPADRTPIPQRRFGFRWRLPAQGHPRVHGARGRAGCQPGADVPA